METEKKKEVSLLERIICWLMSIGKRSYESYYEESCAIFDITEREGTRYLNIGGTLIPAEHFKDAGRTLEYIRAAWIFERKNK